MTPNPQYPQAPGQPAGAAPQGKSGLAIAAFIVALVGLPLLICVPAGHVLELVALGLGIAALTQIQKSPGLGGRGFATTGIVLPVVVFVGSSIAAALLVPRFRAYQAETKQAECKANLKALYAAERSFFAQKDTFSTNIQEIGWNPERGNRYAYFLFDVGQVEDRSSATPASGPGVTGVNVDSFKHQEERPIAYGDLPPIAGNVKAGVHGQCPSCSFVAVCAGNLDKDGTLDVWSISTEARTGPNGENIPAGEPFNDVNDVME